MSGPQVTIDLDRIEHNARTVVQSCGKSGIAVFGVTKGACGMPSVAKAMLRGGVVGLAESRFENIRRLRASGISAPIMLLRSPPPGRAEELVRTVDISLQSELAVICDISSLALRIGRVHDIILMVDLGDLREGIWPTDLLPTVERIAEMKGVRLAGLGTNLSCLGAIVPTRDNLNQLVAYAYKVERLTGQKLDWISGGNSSSLPLLLAGGMPEGINNLRIGEAIIGGGRDTFLDHPWEALQQDACQLSADVLEVKLKPSVPIGQSGVDAFGNKPVFVDEGDRLRAIANLGREDVLIDGLTPVHSGVRIIGASSDHLVMDVTDASPPVTVGDRISFRMDYGAMLAVMTSEYVEKVPMHDAEPENSSKLVNVVAGGDSQALLEGHRLRERLETIGFEVVAAAGQAAPPAGSVTLSVGAFRDEAALPALAATAASTHSFGLIWMDSRAMLMPGAEGEAGALAHILGLTPQPSPVQPQLSPENTVLVGLREVAPEEAKALKLSRASTFTMAEIDSLGMREVMRQALKIAMNGTTGFHLCYAPEVTEFSGTRVGSGGITIRETHQALEAAALTGALRSISVAGVSSAQEPQILAELAGFILSAFGKRIL